MTANLTSEFIDGAACQAGINHTEGACPVGRVAYTCSHYKLYKARARFLPVQLLALAGTKKWSKKWGK
jgi:hypothetical protein